MKSILVFPLLLFTAGYSAAIKDAAPTTAVRDSLVKDSLDLEAQFKERQRLGELEKAREQARIQDLRSELRKIRLADSILWIKVQASRSSDASPETLLKERERRKQANLSAFCNSARFGKPDDLDSLKSLTAEEHSYCADQVRKTASPAPMARDPQEAP